MNQNTNRTKAKSSFALVIVTIIEKLLGFMKQIIFAAFFGSTANTDYYYLAQNIVSIFNSSFNTSVPMSFLSVYVSQGVDDKEIGEKKKFLENSLTSIVLIGIMISGILFFVTFLMNFTPIKNYINDFSILQQYIYSLTLMISFYCLSGTLGSCLECLGIYTPSKLAALFVSLSSIIGIILFGRNHGLIIAIYSMLFGIMLHSLYEFVLLRRVIKIKFVKPKLNNNIKRIMILSFPIMFSSGISSINSLIDKFIASTISDGAISALNYAHIVSIELVSAVVITAISSVIIAMFANSIKSNNYEVFNNEVKIVLDLMMMAIIPIVCIFLFNSKEIISILFERGAFDSRAVDSTSIAFIGYTFGLLVTPFSEVFVRIQYAYQDSKKPLINSFLSAIVNTVLSVFFSSFLGVFGVAFSTSVSVFFNVFLNYRSIKNNKKVTLKINLDNVIKFTTASIITTIACILLKINIHFNTFTNLLLYTICFLILYFIILYILLRDVFVEYLSKIYDLVIRKH